MLRLLPMRATSLPDGPMRLADADDTVWNGHMDGSLARELGFTPVVQTMYRAAADASM